MIFRRISWWLIRSCFRKNWSFGDSVLASFDVELPAVVDDMAHRPDHGLAVQDRRVAVLEKADFAVVIGRLRLAVFFERFEHGLKIDFFDRRFFLLPLRVDRLPERRVPELFAFPLDEFLDELVDFRHFKFRPGRLDGERFRDG